MVLVRHDDILQHADDDGRVLVAAERYAERRAAWRGRLICTLAPVATAPSSGLAPGACEHD